VIAGLAIYAGSLFFGPFFVRSNGRAFPRPACLPACLGLPGPACWPTYLGLPGPACPLARLPAEFGECNSPVVASLTGVCANFAFVIWQLCTYHWGLITQGRTTYEDIKNTRRHYPAGIEPTRAENCKMFFATVQRPSYVGSESGLLAASGGIDMEEVAQQKLDYMQDMEAFAAGRGPFGISDREAHGSPRPSDVPRGQGQTAGEDTSLHNPLPL
jgi:hypothetical protein